jgi:hypothetical protein
MSGVTAIHYNPAANQNVVMPANNRWLCTKDGAAGQTGAGKSLWHVGSFTCHPNGSPSMQVVVEARCDAMSPDHNSAHTTIYDATAGTKIDFTVTCMTK